MFNFTTEEKKVVLFVSGMALCGLILSCLVKVNSRIEKIIQPQIQLAKIDLNKVKLNELIELRCVPSKLAQAIIEYRSMRQEFSSLEELKEVKGIGNRRYEKLKEIFFIE